MLGTILESILTGAAQGSRTASRKIPGGLGGLLGATLAGALFGRKASSSTVRNAALLGAGAVAWNFYRKWAAAQKARAQQGTAAALYSAGQEDPTADLVVKSLIFAARSDGKIDEQERQCIRAVLEGMLPNGCSEELLQRCLQEPLDPAAIAEQVESAEQAEDVYRLSCSVISIDEFAERDYMDALAEALQIPRARQAELEAEAAEASQALLS